MDYQSFHISKEKKRLELFLQWMKKNGYQSVLNGVQKSLNELEHYCNERSIFNGSIYSISKLDTLSSIREQIRLKNSRIYKSVLFALDLYATFLKKPNMPAKKMTPILVKKSLKEDPVTTVPTVMDLNIEADVASWPKSDGTWTLGERALLYDMYLACETLPYSEWEIKIKNFSKMLRSAASEVGLAIDDKYRNFAGIRLQLYTILYILTDSKKGISSPSKSTQQICHLYNSNRRQYQQLLAAMQKRISDALSSKQDTTALRPEQKLLVRPITCPSQGKKANEVDKIELFVKDMEINGAKLNDIVEYIAPKSFSINSIRNYLDSAPWAVAMPDKTYIHRDCIIDIDEATETMFKILKMQFSMFNGYTTDLVFYDAVSIELAMFLNDNDFADPEKVYYLARHIFVVEKYARNTFFFYSNKHIWEIEPDTSKSVFGILMAFIKSCGGKATRDECINYLDKLKITSVNINGVLRIDNNSDLLQYRSGEFLLSEVLSIDDTWLGRIKNCLDLILDDQPYIILRGLNTKWFSRLPTLPVGLTWEPLLLQEVIQKYIPEFRAVQALDGQSLDTIKAGFVPQDSGINTFADLVHAYLVLENVFSLPNKLAAEELREMLRQFGMIEGNELIFNMHKALNDRRFAWASDNNSVKILEK